jgi:hypothetical protein
MKSKIVASGLLVLILSALPTSACFVTIRVACPNDHTASGIKVCITGIGCAVTDSLGIASIFVPPCLGTYTICVDTSTLPVGATVSPLCQNVTVSDETPPPVEFTLDGSFCTVSPPSGPCWLTGGGTVDKIKGQPHYSYGGVVYPGCSPKAADGGNWNVIDHAAGLHFQGQHIIVDSCSGVSTQSPRVNVNIIDFHGVGIISGVDGNPAPKSAVTFVGRAVDNLEPGHGNDLLFISVSNGSGVVLQIGNSATDPAVITTGNLQIHTSSCGK